MLERYLMVFRIERKAEKVPPTSKEFPPVPNDALTPPVNIKHFPAKNNSGGVHSSKRRSPILI